MAQIQSEKDKEMKSSLVIFAVRLIIYTFATPALHIRRSAELFVSNSHEVMFTRATLAHVPLESPPKASLF